MKIHDPSDRSGTPVPGSGTARASRYGCEVCHDSGLVFGVVVTDSPDRRIRTATCSPFMPCPSCDGKSRLAGEVDDTVPTPFMHLLKNIRHGGPS